MRRNTKNKRMVHVHTLLLPIYTPPRYHPHVRIVMIEILKNWGEKWRPEWLGDQCNYYVFSGDRTEVIGR